MYRLFLKRLFDVFVSFSIICIASPVIIILMIILYFSNNGKPFFFQIRPGKNEDLFKLVKFKSMNDKKDENGELLPNHLRITKIGKFIRKTSLDELPQLFNVLKGEMSLIGPRPLLLKYLPLYNEEQRKRHLVKPGVTGWAQVNGRNSISWQKRFELDIWYVDNVSFLTDLKVMLLTLQKVLLRKDIDSGDTVGMVPFTGNNTENE
ncbi:MULTISPECIES: sugar transferase [Flavobacteriaceae]|uniref:sugar transferase n=1 Tax=Flavobacteriaceae TaxID=49546 RepID=UPI00149280A9|nr:MULTISPECIES: sugar transferase [Allomuricauda]MDC6366879.1 sugar transferase [Muricauda sp. AC10]